MIRRRRNSSSLQIANIENIINEFTLCTAENALAWKTHVHQLHHHRQDRWIDSIIHHLLFHYNNLHYLTQRSVNR